ncbi:hypothetical protein LNI98_12055 [Tenacibaculum dicentrarchi]|nr:hypothetical protein [Tenacibaculum dicentrarchi]MCD8436032.1 hypothetical protein [Tenacibaculum dicentrarchi]MCD8450422.1 hypothetical protein [Tenacibaculum dicentrarchi]MCG8838941.1 hypothetical protein [Tenacibaculum dicentrarchi]
MSRKKFKNGVPLWFIIGCIYKYNFKSIKRLLLYIFYLSGYINLKEKKSESYTNEDIAYILMFFYDKKIKKQVLYDITDCTKTTFNKKLDSFFKENNFTGRRSFTLYEITMILSEWQGENKWALPYSIKKKELADILHKGDYKKISAEFSCLIGEENYKNIDKFSPNEVKKLLSHIDLENSKESERILKYNLFKKISIIIFIILTSIYLYKSNKYGIFKRLTILKRSKPFIKIFKLFSFTYFLLTLSIKKNK